MKRFTRAVAAALTAGLSLAQTNDPPATPATPVVVATNAPVYVDASRTFRPTLEIPANVSVISAEAIRQSGLTDTAQALEHLGGLYLRRYSGNPSQVDLSLRGFGENSHGRVLVLVDGQRINNADMAPANFQRIPLQNVDRIEIIRGPQTALYGDYAVSGVINIITHAPSLEHTRTLAAHAGSDDTYGAAITASGPIAGDALYSLSAIWNHSGGWRDNAGYHDLYLEGNVTELLADRVNLRLTAFYAENQYDMPGSLTRQQMKLAPKHTTTPFDNYDAKLWGLKTLLDAETQSGARFTATLSATRRDASAEMPSWYTPTISDTLLDTLIFSPRAALPYTLGTLENTLTLGGDVHFERLRFRNKHLRSRASLYDSDLNRLTGALYAHNETRLTDTLTLTLGGRLERTRLRGDTLYYGAGQDNATVIRDGSSYDAALLYRPLDTLKLYARLSSLYRYPFLDEQVSYNGGYPIGVNQDLKPERGYNYELGTELRLHDELLLNLNLYHMDMKNEIAVDPSTWQQMNLNKTRHQGLDAELSWRRDRVAAASLIYSYARAKFRGGDYDDATVPLVPRHTLTLRGELQFQTDFALIASLRATDAQHLGSDFANRSDKLAGFATLDLALRYTPSYCKNLQLIFSCDNILDKTYATMAYYVDMGGYVPDTQAYYPANGRTWRLSASYTF